MAVISKIKNWFKNYWYYYKWAVLIGSFFICIIIFCTVQSTGRESYDISILYTGPHIFEIGEKSSLENTFQQIMTDDYNGDGKKNIQIVGLSAFTDEQIKEAVGEDAQPQQIMHYAPYAVENVKEDFSQHVFSGDTVICILDPYWYEKLLNADALVKLEEVLGYRPKELVDDYSAKFIDLPFSEFFSETQKLPEDAVICFRKMSTASVFTGTKKAEKNYENSQGMLRLIFDFKREG